MKAFLLFLVGLGCSFALAGAFLLGWNKGVRIPFDLPAITYLQCFVAVFGLNILLTDLRSTPSLILIMLRREETNNEKDLLMTEAAGVEIIHVVMAYFYAIIICFGVYLTT